MMRIEHATLRAEPQIADTSSPAPSCLARRNARASWSVLARLHLTYLWRHRRFLSIDQPMRFTELVQRRKLLNRDPRLPQLIDKLAVTPRLRSSLGAA